MFHPAQQEKKQTIFSSKKIRSRKLRWAKCYNEQKIAIPKCYNEQNIALPKC